MLKVFREISFNLLVLSNLLQRKPSGRIFLQDVGQEVREARFQPVRGDPLALANVLQQLVDVVTLVRVQTGCNVVTGRLEGIIVSQNFTAGHTQNLQRYPGAPDVHLISGEDVVPVGNLRRLKRRRTLPRRAFVARSKLIQGLPR